MAPLLLQTLAGLHINSKEFISSIMMKMIPPQNQAVSEIAKETGLSEANLHKWRK